MCPGAGEARHGLIILIGRGFEPVLYVLVGDRTGEDQISHSALVVPHACPRSLSNWACISFIGGLLFSGEPALESDLGCTSATAKQDIGMAGRKITRSENLYITLPRPWADRRRKFPSLVFQCSGGID